jgi:hypothetical protein
MPPKGAAVRQRTVFEVLPPWLDDVVDVFDRGLSG